MDDYVIARDDDKITISHINIAEIHRHEGQPRRHFDKAALEELAESISQRGVLQPVMVRPRGKGGFELIAGERRWRAAQIARLHEIPAIIRELDDKETFALALIENLQREDLNPVEEAQAYQKLEEQGYKKGQIAEMVHKSRPYVANLMRLLELPEEVLQLVVEGQLSSSQARTVISAKDPLAIAKQIIEKNLSVREVEALIRAEKAGHDIEEQLNKVSDEIQGNNPLGVDIMSVINNLEDQIGIKIEPKTQSRPEKGALVLHYKSASELDMIFARLSGQAF